MSTRRWLSPPPPLIDGSVSLLLPRKPERASLARSPSHYAITTVDSSGRIGDSSTVRMLAWEPRAAVAFSPLAGADAVLVVRDGPSRITRQGRLRLPASIRRTLGLGAGDSVLVAADSDRDLLVVYSVAAVHAMAAWYLERAGSDRLA